MKRLVLALVLALVLVGSVSAEPLATYNHTFEFGGSGSGSVVSSVITDEVYSSPSTVPQVNLQRSFLTVYVLDSYAETHDSVYAGVSTDSGFLSAELPLTDDYLLSDPSDNYRSYRYSYVDYFGLPVYTGSINMVSSSIFLPDGNIVDDISEFNFEEYYGFCEYSWLYPNNINGFARVTSIQSLYFSVEPFDNSEPFNVFVSIEVLEPWFDLFGMRGLTSSFTPSNPDEDYYILFAGSDSWVGQNPDKWVWTRVHGSTEKYKIIFSGNEYIWFVKYKDEIQQFSFNYTGEEGVVPPVIVPDPEPEQPDTPPIIETPGETGPTPSMPDIESPDLTVDFTSGFDDYENMTIYQDLRRMVDGFTSSIAPNIETTQLYQSLQQLIAYLELAMEQLREKYAVPIYNILASVSSFIPSICWFAVDIAIIFGMFRFVVHIVTGPISSAIRERF